MPKNKQELIMAQMHKTLFNGHLGFHKTWQRIRKKILLAWTKAKRFKIRERMREMSEDKIDSTQNSTTYAITSTKATRINHDGFNRSTANFARLK